MAKYHNFGALHDELVKDILVVSVCDKRFLKGLRLDDLSQEKAVTCIGQSEMVHQQQIFLRGDDTRQFPCGKDIRVTR